MSETGDTDALAAEFALGTLDGPERAQAHALLGVNQPFADKVRLWERRLGELHLMVEPVEPDPGIWQRIKGKVPVMERPPEAPPEPEAAEAALSALVPSTPEAAPPTAVAADGSTAPSAAELTPPQTPVPSPSTAVAPDSTVEAASSSVPLSAPSAAPAPIPSSTPTALARSVTPAAPAPTLPPAPTLAPPAASAERAPTMKRPDVTLVLRRRLRRWRVLATLLFLVLLAAGGLIAAWKYAPEQVPPRLRALELLRLIGITVAAPPVTRPSAPPESQFDE